MKSRKDEVQKVLDAESETAQSQDTTAITNYAFQNPFQNPWLQAAEKMDAEAEKFNEKVLALRRTARNYRKLAENGIEFPISS